VKLFTRVRSRFSNTHKREIRPDLGCYVWCPLSEGLATDVDCLMQHLKSEGGGFLSSSILVAKTGEMFENFTVPDRYSSGNKLDS